MKPCRVTGGEHIWKEGGARDFGRYHCAACQQCLFVDGLIKDERKARAENERLRAALREIASLPVGGRVPHSKHLAEKALAGPSESAAEKEDPPCICGHSQDSYINPNCLACAGEHKGEE